MLPLDRRLGESQNRSGGRGGEKNITKSYYKQKLPFFAQNMVVSFTISQKGN
jgi:hypothetical protein